MLHKRYNYKRPLTLGVIFFIIFLRTNTVYPDSKERNDILTKSSHASENIKAYMAFNSNSYSKESILYSLYHRLISQFQ
ncbi:MAG TPA: hypothetical protein VGP55_01145 [Chitinophagaceae bacterium]|nr:hypothetical protein [Chitinophagaceae bacterium]